MQKFLLALKRRDIPGIMQAIQKSPTFQDICENRGIFDAEPQLWKLVCDKMQMARN